MNILVTGGAGFIGSHIVDAYISQGHKVVAIDTLSQGKREHLDPRARLYEVDIRDFATLQRIFEEERFEVVNHHAAESSVARSEKDPETAHAINIEGTRNILSLCTTYAVKKILFASSGGTVYGEANEIPTSESASLVPLSLYGKTKLEGEKLIQQGQARGGPAYTILRYGNVYGPRQNPHGESGVIMVFANLIKHNQTPTMFGDGRQTRDYVHVSDVVTANLLALSKGENEIYNIGTGVETSTKKIYTLIAQLLSWPHPPHIAPTRPGDIMRSALAVSKAERLLGWHPTISLEQGVATTLADF